MNLHITTYNVLAQCFVEPERYGYVTPNTLLEAKRRRQHLVHHIVSLPPEIVLLQEVEVELLAALETRLGPHHRILYTRRPTHSDGCAILLRRDIELLSHESLVYRDREPGYSQVACIAHIRLGSLEMSLASTHLRCGCQARPGEPSLGQLQMRELLAIIEESGHRRWVLGGDLNAHPESPTLREAGAVGFRRTHDAPTAYLRGVRSKRDYLLHTEALHLEGIAPPHFERLPDTQEPSDHVAFTARLTPTP